jgi:retron-type reverse transcriptase
MKREGNIYQDIISVDNLILADKRARKGKGNQYGIEIFDRNKEANLLKLHNILASKAYNTSSYKTFKIFDPKERDIYCLPYYPDRIVHHAAMIPLEKIFVSSFTADTYSCIKGRGIHKALRAVRKALRDEQTTKYCLKLDIKKFYQNIDHDILKQLLRRKIKDSDLLLLLDNVIDSAQGVPIGNYLSQYFANFYLSYFDHWIKETKKVKYYFRYADDMVILARDKASLHQLLFDIREYLRIHLKLQIKDNYQIFPVASRGIDFVGYVIYHTHVRIRKTIKKNFGRAIHYRRIHSIPSYMGWAKHCNSGNLIRKLAA